MLAELNRIKNADFSQGKHKPRMWKWTSSGDDVDWQAVPTSSNGALRGVQLTCGDIEGGGFWSQKFRCKRDQFYRIEAVVSCECQCEDPEGGMVLQLVPFDDAGNALEPFAFAPLRFAHEFTQRGYFKADKPIASVELQIGLRNATGTAAVHDVRAIPIIEPEGRSHATALPPPPFAHDPPKPVKTVSVITQ
ncbi:MAG: hypothetical protein GXP29_01650, partial [Planctomycetes bacterium]|nr:hypothetical protein [Planctomycetota bacterium]